MESGTQTFRRRPLSLRRIIVFLAILVSAGSVWARPRLGAPEVMAPVFIDGVSVGSVLSFPRSSAEEFSFDAEPLLRLLGAHLAPEILELLRSRQTPEGALSLAALQSFGLSVSFNAESSELRVMIPEKARQVWQFDLSRDESLLREVKSARSSGYLNMRATQNRVERSDVPEATTPLHAQLEFVQQYRGFVFETGGLYQEQTASLWTRQDTRIVHDREESMLRWTVGDLPSRSVGFQSPTRMGGLSMRREFSIRPERTALRLAGQELVLKRDSVVQFWVNGALFSQVRLNAGRFNLREFPLLAGLNTVEVRVRDDLGQEEKFEFDLLFDAGLLEDGVHEFSYDFGYPWSLSGGDRVYDTDAVFSSISHRLGVSKSFTMGVNFQNWLYRSLAGMELTRATRMGLFSVEGALSHILGVTGGAGRFRWRSPDRFGGLDSSWRFGLEFLRRADSFFQVTPDPLVSDDAEDRYDVQISKMIGTRATLGLNLFEERAFFLGTDRRGARANLTVPLGGMWRTEFFYQRTEGGAVDERAGVTLSWSELSGRMTVNVAHEGPRAATSALVHRSNAQPMDDYRWTLSARNEENTSLAGVSGEYLMAPAAVRLDHVTQTNAGVRGTTTGVGLDSAVVWADGVFALSQPVVDAFVMARSRGIPAGHTVRINPNGDAALARLTERRDRAVLQEMGSYSAYDLAFSGDDLPSGSELGQNRVRVRPGYRSGVLVQADVQARVTLRGRILGLDGAALVLMGGEIRSQDGRLVEGHFFTDRQGNFVIEALRPGAYVVVFADSNLPNWTFQVNAAVFEQEMGTVHLTSEGTHGGGQ